MALYKFDACVCTEADPFSDVTEKIGEYVIGLFADNGITTIPTIDAPQSQSALLALFDDDKVGGGYILFNSFSNDNLETNLSFFNYIEALPLLIPDVYKNNDFRLKLKNSVDEDKFFITRPLGESVTFSTGLLAYFNDGISLIPFNPPGSGQMMKNVDATYKNVISYAVMVDNGTNIYDVGFYQTSSDGAVNMSRSSLTTQRSAAIRDFLASIPEYDPDEGVDPYAAGGISGTGGGGGSFDFTDQGFSVPALPSVSAVDTGFTTLFNPSLAQLKNLSTYMWTNPLFDLGNWKAIFANPMDAILALNIIPIAVDSAGARSVKVGNLSTDVTMTVAASEWVSRDCGSITIPEYWGAYLDYNPYTKLQLYLPYVGFVQLDTDDVIGKSLGVVYHADIISGAAVAFVTVGGKVHYSYNCNVATSIPVTGDNFSRVMSGLISTTSGIAGMATGISGGSLGSALGGAGQAVSGVTNMIKPDIQRGGGLPASSGFLGVKYPFVCITRPRQCVPQGQNSFIGYPVYDNVQLTEITGYTEVDKIHLDAIPATETELSELETLLENGVIL